MKNFKKVLALVLAVVMLLSFATVASAVTSDFYKDVDDIDYKEAVDVLGTIGVLEGYPDNTFLPEKTITRAEAAKIIAMFDNKSSKINGLYASANPFSDCVDHWAESYIAYGVKTGIIAGVGGDKFAPSANVTGVQFLKMVLVVLGYDAKAEGLEGKNWDVNTLALAKRAGLTATLGVKFDYSAYLKRQEAAVIMLDALRADVVEYGSKFVLGTLKYDEEKGFYYGSKGDQPYMTVAGAVKTGDKLMKDWGLKEDKADDAFMRPYRTWLLNGKTVASYMYTPKAEYKIQTDFCQVLVDLGVAKNDHDTVINVAGHFINGLAAVNFDTVVGQHHHNYEGTAYDGLVDEGPMSYCDEKAAIIGAQGTLTQVFYVDGAYRVTEIDTWLANVDSAKKTTTNRDGHLTSYTISTLGVYTDYPGCRSRALCLDGVAVTTDAEGLAKDDKVILNYSFKDGKAYNVTVAKGTAGKFDGFKVINYPSQTRIDGTYVDDSAHFHAGYDESKWYENFGTKVFYYDFYGNVIGMFDDDATVWDYLVIDKAALDHVEMDPVFYANVVGLDAQMKKMVTVASIFGYDAQDIAEFDEFQTVFGYYNDELYDELFAYTLNDDGEYIIEEVDSIWFDDVVIVKGQPVVDAYEDDFATNAATKYLIEENDGSFTAVTGFRAIDSLYAAHAQIVDEDGDGIAEVVYLYGFIARDGDKQIAYVTEPATLWVEDYEGETFTKMTIYVDGVATEVYVDPISCITYFNSATFQPGFYEFHYLSVGANTFVTVSQDLDDLAELNTVHEVDGVTGDVVILDGKTLYLPVADSITYYSIRVDGTVAKEDAKYAETYLVGAHVFIKTNDAGELIEVYVLEDQEF